MSLPEVVDRSNPGHVLDLTAVGVEYAPNTPRKVTTSRTSKAQQELRENPVKRRRVNHKTSADVAAAEAVAAGEDGPAAHDAGAPAVAVAAAPPAAKRRGRPRKEAAAAPAVAAEPAPAPAAPAAAPAAPAAAPEPAPAQPAPKAAQPAPKAAMRGAPKAKAKVIAGPPAAYVPRNPVQGFGCSKCRWNSARGCGACRVAAPGPHQVLPS
jgi:nucleoid-associated protein YgaU